MSVSHRIPIAVLLLCAFGLGLFHIVSNDVWWHLASGRWVAEYFSIPYADPFSYTTSGERWIYHNWLFDLPLYIVERAGGVTGLILLRAFLVVLLAVAVYVTLSKQTSSATAAVLTVMVLIAVRDRFFLRPHLASFIFFTIELSLLSALYKKDKIDPMSAACWLVPVVMFFWANMHAGAIFGIILIASFWVSSMLERKNKNSFLVLLCVSFAAGLLNPNLMEIYVYPFKFLAIKQSLPFVNEEHMPPGWLTKEPRLALFWIFSIVGALAFLLGIKKAPPYLTILYLGFGWLALTSMRGIALFTIINAFAISKLWLKNINGKPALVLMPFITAVALYLHPYKMKFEVAELTAPVSAADFVEKSGIKGNMFNSHPFGGYLIHRFYPNRKVFIDGRDVLHEKTMRLINEFGYRKSLFAYRVEWIIAGYRDGVLKELPKEVWSVIFFDDVSVVLARRFSQNDKLIEKYGYRHITPFNLEKRIKKAKPDEIDAIEKELKRA
ncbi:MAG: hypothetical protein ACE5EN_07925, partial [Nitrospinota bacterium]